MNKTDLRKIVKKEAKNLFRWAIDNKRYGTVNKVFKIDRCHIVEGNAHITIEYYPLNLYVDELFNNKIFKYIQYTSTMDANKLEIVLFIRKENLNKLEANYSL